MSITNGDILEYVKTVRMFPEDGQYLLQEYIDKHGLDCVGSARAWVYGRFFSAEKTDIYNAWVATTWDDLIDTDLADLPTVRAAYTALDADLSELHTLIFEIFTRLVIFYIFKNAQMHGYAEEWREEAVGMLSAIVGVLANSDNVTDNGDAGVPIGAVVCVTDNWTDDEITDYLGGYE